MVMACGIGRMYAAGQGQVWEGFAKAGVKLCVL